jgi:transposase
MQEQIPWAAPLSRITYRLEYLVLKYCRVMPQKAVAELLHIPTSTVSDLLHRSITRVRKGHKIRGLRKMGVDEISYCRGHKYATVVYDLKRGCVVWVGKGKERETIDRFFREELSQYQRDRIEWVCSDMSQAFIGAVKQWCENAKLVLDRFHVVKALNEAVDEVRKEQWRQVSGEQRKVLKGLRWVLFRHSSSRSGRDNRTLKELEKANNRIYRAWRLKDEFEHFWNYKAPWAAVRFINSWMTSALRSRLDPLRKFVQTLRRHYSGVLAFIGSRLTNSMAEGLNRVIRIVKNRASGFCNLDSFTDMIFLCVGDVDIPSRIPCRFRVL